MKWSHDVFSPPVDGDQMSKIDKQGYYRDIPVCVPQSPTIHFQLSSLVTMDGAT